MEKKTAICTTTINVPDFLDGICKNASEHNHKNISIYVIGDKKTPAETEIFCKKIKSDYSVDIEYFSLEAQEHRLDKYKKLLNIVPYNSGSRKLLANLMAYLDGCDTVIQIDDDNFIGTTDFIGEHNVVGENKDIKLYKSDKEWYNIYEQLIEKNNIPFFPRGFPWTKRVYERKQKIEEISETRKVALINGLVLEDPDVDAISRLFWPIRVTGSKHDLTKNFGLFPGTWSSFNNQNTSTSKETTPVYFTPYDGGRNSDIWTSYVMCKLCEVSGDVIAFGSPYVKQYRNKHNLWVDLEDELKNNILSDYFVDLLKSIDLNKSNYLDMLNELLEKSLIKLDNEKNLDQSDVEYIRKYFKGYQIWSNCFTN